MTSSELNKFQMILNTKEAELMQRMRKRDGIAIERTADALDEVRLAAERELTTRRLEMESVLLRNVRAALGRFASRTYGICIECEDEISGKRLNAMPWATLCIGCQEQADRDGKKGAATRDAFLLNAA